MNQLEKIAAYLAARASEASTWQGVAFILTLAGSRYANMDWGQCAALGATLSGIIKILFPDGGKS